jgi:hypothetical protein
MGSPWTARAGAVDGPDDGRQEADAAVFLAMAMSVSSRTCTRSTDSRPLPGATTGCRQHRVHGPGRALEGLPNLGNAPRSELGVTMPDKRWFQTLTFVPVPLKRSA